MFLSYGQLLGPQVAFSECESVGNWLVFAGGLWIDPAVECVEIIVDAKDSSDSRTIGVEDECA